MLIALLPSEIARLVLNYLEEEKYTNTYDCFLNECRYLEECKIYLKQGISLPRTIHGKKLGDYLILENTENESIIKVDKDTQTTESEYFEESTEVNVSLKSESTEPDIGVLFPNESRKDETNTEIASNSSLVDETMNDLHKMDETKTIKSPEIKLIKSPEKKIRLDVKPEIYTISSDESDDKIQPENKKRRLLIGKNVEKVPELSVSTLQRQLVSIISDATNHLKQQEDQEKLLLEQQQQQQQQQQQNVVSLQRNSLEILNTIKKGPPLGDFQFGLPNFVTQQRIQQQPQQLHLPTQFQLQLNPQQQTQQVFIVSSNPNFVTKQDQFIKIPQIASVNTLNCVNMPNINDTNINKSNYQKPNECVFLENALKSFDTNTNTNLKPKKDANKLIMPRLQTKLNPTEPKRKSISEQDKSETTEKKKKTYVRHTTTIKSIFEKSINSTENNSNLNVIASSNPIPIFMNEPVVNLTNTTSSSTVLVEDNSKNQHNINETNISSEGTNENGLKYLESRYGEEIFELLGIDSSKTVSEKKNNEIVEKFEPMVTDFDLDDLVKTSEKTINETPFSAKKNSPEIANRAKAMKKKSSLKKETNDSDDLEIIFNESTLNKSDNNNTNNVCTRTLRTRTCSQRRMI